MRLFTLLLSALLLTLISTTVLAAPEKMASGGKHMCKIVTGYGTAIGTGDSKSSARDAAREKCGTAMIDDYFARRRDIPDSVKDDLALACINLDCQ